ncbi:MAG: hypothetical protein NTU94_00230, partial [Planctomycetota bacterium]|nr:hypothetical protein [Planctomycetota bacterium]
VASGTLQLVGIEGVTVVGTALLRFNNTGQAVDKTLSIAGSDRDVVVRFDTAADVASFQAIDLQISLLGQGLRGDFAFEKTTVNGQPAILVGAANVSLSLGDQVRLRNGSGALLLSAQGLAGQVAAPIEMSLPGVGFTGNFNLAVNSTGAPVSTSVTVNGTTIPLNLPAGPYLRVTGQAVSLTVAGQTLSGNFFFEQITTAGGARLTRLAAMGVTMDLGGGIVTLVGGEGSFLLTAAGLAGRLTGQIAVNVTGVSFGSGFTVAVNTTTAAVAETFVVDGQSIALNLPAGPYLRVEAAGTTLDILGQHLQGDFAFERTTDSSGAALVRVAAANVGLSLGNGSQEFVKVANGTGSFLLTSAGLAGRIGATVSVTIPGVSVSGSLALEINQTGVQVDEQITVGSTLVTLALPAGPFLRVTGIGVNIDILGQRLSGNFVFEQKTNTAGQKVVRVGATNVSVSLGGGLVTVSGGTALFVISAAGFAGSFSGAVTLGVPNVSFGANLTVEVNTTAAAVNEEFDLGGGNTESLVLAAGQYVRVAGTGVTLNVLGQQISGNFVLEKGTTAGGQQVVKVAVAGASLKLGDPASPFVQVLGATGGFIISSQGVSASLTVNSIAVNLPGVTAGAGITTVEFSTVAAPVKD